MSHAEPPPTLREFFEEKFGHQDEKLDRILEKQDLTNGRVRSAEQSIAVLTWAYGIGVVVIGWIVYKLP